MTVNQYCTRFREKIEIIVNGDEFISSKLVPVRAGMQHNNKKYKIQTIGTKRIYYRNRTHPDGDIQLIGHLSMKTVRGLKLKQ